MTSQRPLDGQAPWGGPLRVSPSRTIPKPIPSPQTRWKASRPYRPGGEDVGVPSTARRILGRAGGRTRRLIPLAPCPVEGCPIGSCTPPIPASTSNCSLRCSPNPQLPFLQPRPIFRNRPIHKLLAKTAPTSLFSCHFQVQNSPRLVFRELTPIPVHGYDTTSGPFAPMSSKGRTRASSHIRHGVPPHDPSDSAAGKPAVTAGRVLTPARRREI